MGVMVLALIGSAQAQVIASVQDSNAMHATSQSSIDQWLMRLQAASRQRSYSGTFVVTTGNYMSSARIWHVCEGEQQLERVEALTGAPRSTFRRNDHVLTFLPASRMAISEKRAFLGIFPDLLNRADASIAQFYQLKALGHDHVAGFLTDVIQLVPRDRWRFGYRIWTEQASGLVVKLQTLDALQSVLEQAAFSELQLTQPISWARLGAMMDNTDGYSVKESELIATVADKEGWQLKTQLPGFKSMSCHRRREGDLIASRAALQWVFSDGLASVSLFIEAFDAARHGKPQRHDQFAMGATHMQTRRLGDWWLTVVGEVPQQTLQMFAQSLERKK
jgi:sigma-E factor negative regulatory protein RseB